MRREPTQCTVIDYSAIIALVNTMSTPSLTLPTSIVAADRLKSDRPFPT